MSYISIIYLGIRNINISMYLYPSITILTI